MARVIEIQKLGQSRLDNSLHTWFHGKVYDSLCKADAGKIGIPSTLIAEYRSCINNEIRMLKEPGEENETEAIMKKDSECDRRLSFILGIVRIMRLSPRAEEADAAMRLYVLTRQKKRIQAEGIGRKPARILFLLNELKKPENAADIALLHLSEAVDLLEIANNEAERLQAQRTIIRAKKKRPSATQIRPKTDEVYHDILLRLQFAYKNNEPPIDRAAIVELVDNLNEYTAHARTTYKKSLAQRRAKRRAKEEPPEQP